MKKEILEQLYKPFDLKSRPGQGGQSFQYAESDDIIDRMNRVFMGNWGTEIVESKIIEDQIVLRVRVNVTDPETSRTYSHEGYASQFIARYTFGDKKDKPIDFGNSFKSAMSKAIKTAVSRWGVGLYLEKTSDEEMLPDAPSNIFTEPQMPKPLAKIADSMPAPFDIPPDSFLEPPTESKKVKPPEPAPPIYGFDVPPVFSDAVVVKASPKNEAPIFSGAVAEEEYVTDIQKVAIETIMAVHNISFQDLSSRALGRSDNLPASTDVIKYSDAVKMIQFGNNLK